MSCRDNENRIIAWIEKYQGFDLHLSPAEKIRRKLEDPCLRKWHKKGLRSRRRKIQEQSEKAFTGHCEKLCAKYKEEIEMIYFVGYFGILKDTHLKPLDSATQSCTCNSNPEGAALDYLITEEEPEGAELDDLITEEEPEGAELDYLITEEEPEGAELDDLITEEEPEGAAIDDLITEEEPEGAAALVHLNVDENQNIDHDLDLLMDPGEDFDYNEDIIYIDNINAEPNHQPNMSNNARFLRRRERYAQLKIRSFRSHSRTRLERALTLMDISKFHCTLGNLKIRRRTMSLEYHPDKAKIPSANQMMTCINESCKIIKNYLNPPVVEVE